MSTSDHMIITHTKINILGVTHSERRVVASVRSSVAVWWRVCVPVVASGAHHQSGHPLSSSVAFQPLHRVVFSVIITQLYIVQLINIGQIIKTFTNS